VTTEYKKLATQIARLEQRVNAAQRSRLGNASLENSSVPSYDGHGTLQSVWGVQYDGAHGFITVAGPTPPTPGGFEINVGPGFLLVNWLGEWDPDFIGSDDGIETPVVAPSDFSRVELHVSEDPAMSGLMRDTLKTSISTPRGGEARIDLPYGAVVYFRAVTRSTPGKPSVASPVLGPYTIPALTQADLDIDLAAIGGNRISRGSSQPAGPNKIGDLWLQTPSNVAFRWEGDPASWVESRDQGIVEALSDAFAANQAANQAGLDALAAQAAASSKTTTFTQPGQPPAIGRVTGDEWVDTDDGNKRYYWNGSAWTAGTLGAAAISATARQLGAITTFRQPVAPTAGVIDGDFWVDSDDGNRVYIRAAGAWELSRDPDINTAITSAATAQATADGKMRIFPQTVAPTGLTATDVGDMWIDTDDGNKTYTWTGTAWDARLIGNSAIQPQSLVARDVIATGTVSAALLEALFIIANVIIAGNANGEHTRLDSTGLAAYAYEDGLPYETDRYGRGWSVRNTLGAVVASTTQDGIGTLAGLTVNDVDITVGGLTMADRDWARPWGMVGYAELPDVNAFTTSTSAELGYVEMAFDAQPGRSYVLMSEPIQYANDTGSGVRVKIRRTTDGTAPSTSSPQLREIAYLGGTGAWLDRHPLNVYLGGHTNAEPETWRILKTYGVGNGATGAKVWRGEILYFWIMDVGPLRENIGQIIGGTTVGGGTGGGTSTTQPVKKTYTVEYAADWVRTWRQDSTSIITDSEMHQGYADSFNGNRRSSCGFPAVTPLLVGATVNKIQVYMESFYWWNMSGGTMRLGFHGSLGQPATFPGHNGIITVGFTARSQGKWIDVTNVAGWKTSLQNGDFRGISIGGADNSQVYYGKFRGPAYGRPRIKVTYTK
jgi:hypothetical protein